MYKQIRPGLDFFEKLSNSSLNCQNALFVIVNCQVIWLWFILSACKTYYT